MLAAVARRNPEGNVLVAFAGVAKAPVLAESTQELVPPGDFRGSSEYRKSSMAETLRSKGTGGCEITTIHLRLKPMISAR